MLLIYPVIGVTAFEKPAPVETDSLTLVAHGPGASAVGKQTPEGFVVLAGSLARTDTTPSIHNYLKELRQGLIDQGVVSVEVGGLRFTRDYSFNSPSTAAGVILGRTANGRLEWKDEGGRTLKEIQSAEVAVMHSGA